MSISIDDHWESLPRTHLRKCGCLRNRLNSPSVALGKCLFKFSKASVDSTWRTMRVPSYECVSLSQRSNCEGLAFATDGCGLATRWLQATAFSANIDPNIRLLLHPGFHSTLSQNLTTKAWGKQLSFGVQPTSSHADITMMNSLSGLKNTHTW